MKTIPFILAVAALGWAHCTQGSTNEIALLTNYVESVATTAGRSVPPVPASVTNALATLKTETNSLVQPLLVEYGLRLHLQFLEKSGLARKLPVESDPLLATLIASTGIQPYTTAHEAGWLNSQFYGEFKDTGYSSYQVYLWMLETNEARLEWPNVSRIHDLMEAIRRTGRQGIGGARNCHYGCM